MEDDVEIAEVVNVRNEHNMVSDAEKFTDDRLKYIKEMYLKEGEEFAGLGFGGSESITIFVNDTNGNKIVRKILNEQFITAQWEKSGYGVMLPPVRKAISQANYLINLPGSARNLFPKVLSHSQAIDFAGDLDRSQYQYDMTFVKGIEVSRFVREYAPSPRVVALLYAEIFRVLRDRIHVHRKTRIEMPTLEESYFNKIRCRLALCQKTSPKLFGPGLLEADTVEINGRKLRNWHVVIKIIQENAMFRELLEPRFHGLVVGDTNTENIKIENIEPLLNIDESRCFSERQFDADEIGLKFLDPRAIGFHVDGKDTGVDDYMYDNKPWHNSIGNYDHIHGEHFDLAYDIQAGHPKMYIRIHDDSPYIYSYTGVEKYFGFVMNSVYEFFDPNRPGYKDDPNWLVRFVFVMGTHFMAMPPFHFSKNELGEYKDDSESQKRALAIYAEGLRWLNCAVDLLEGKRKGFLGVERKFEAVF